MTQEFSGVRDVDLTFRDPGCHKPFLHGNAVVLAQLVGNALGSGIIQIEGVCSRGINGIKLTHIDPGREEGPLTDDLQWRIFDEQRIDEHDEQHCHQNGKTNHELSGVKNLSNCMAHNGIYPQSDWVALMRGSIKPYTISRAKFAVNTIIVMINVVAEMSG